MNLNIGQNINSNRNGTDKIISISKNTTKLQVSFDFYQGSDFHQKFRVHLCTFISEKNLGALIGAGAQKRYTLLFQPR